MELVHRLEPGAAVVLGDIPTTANGGIKKAESMERLAAVGAEMAELQELLYAAASHSLLIVLQGMDTSGKDGTIRNALAAIDPQGVKITAFKAPTAEELAHDFLWRVHRAVPPRGMIGVFNRSHYEDVLIARVKELVPERLWQPRFAHINDFEQLLIDHDTIILKFFLHISKDEQEARLLAREEAVEKAWKLSVADWEERRFWDAYQVAYQEALQRCSAAAPWLVVPADKKWYRNLAVASTIVETLRPLRESWIDKLTRQSRAQVEALKKFRAQRG